MSSLLKFANKMAIKYAQDLSDIGDEIEGLLKDIIPSSQSAKQPSQTHEDDSDSHDDSDDPKKEQLRNKLVLTARKYIGSTDFRGNDVGGGNLACAKVVSTILQDAGFINKIILNVAGVESELVKNKWHKITSNPIPGDVVVWGPLPSYKNKDGVAMPGHKHIGVMTTDTKSVNNNSSKRMPTEETVNFSSPRGVYFYRL